MDRYPEQPYFQFSRRERNGIISILAILLFFLLLPYIYLFVDKPDAGMEPAHAVPIDILEDSIRSSMNGPASSSTPAPIASYREGVNENDARKTKLFYFDPNTIDMKGWVSLGLTEKTARTIVHFRDKGGRFRKPEDLDKIWGMPAYLADRLKPFVRIEVEQSIQKKENYRVTGMTRHRQLQQRVIDINDADSAAWESLPGIGPSLARRIVAFREKLGGFYSVSQVGETFGLPDSVFRRVFAYLQYKPAVLRLVSINRAGFDELKSHPYIRYKLASALEAYRRQHGPFRSVADIRQVLLVTDSIYQKLSPYLTAD